ncbi:hypothetical protein MNAN1_002153 [Malassezia nana]|uniref:Uncharacterized protein n=1 Tax=Malassezia nana TaxID=180528 RepID=A0AAF0J2M2_9BASI|nr:hypothetical protein MNAN1_002153 [Malassezia nana]
MNPWASPSDEADGAPRAPTPPLSLGTPPPLVSSTALAPLDVDPWGGSALAAPVPKPPATPPRTVAESAPSKDTCTQEGQATDSNLALLTSASLTIHENVWGSGETMQTAWTQDRKVEETRPSGAPVEAGASAMQPKEEASEIPSVAGASETRPETPTKETPLDAGNSGPPAESETRPTAEALAGKPSALGRLGMAVSEWRKARQAAADKAKEAAEAEQAQGWKKVAPPKPAATVRLAGWLRRGTATSTAPTSPAPTPPAPSSEQGETPSPSTKGAPLDDDDLAWLEATSMRTTARAPAAPVRGVRRYDASAYDPDPRYDYDPPSTYDEDAAEDNAAVPHDPYAYDPDDDDGFGEMQTYTDDEPSVPSSTYSDEPRRAPPPAKPTLLPPPPPATKPPPSVDLLGASPPATQQGPLSKADVDFFESL